jgi:hypothetical protein
MKARVISLASGVAAWRPAPQCLDRQLCRLPGAADRGDGTRGGDMGARQRYEPNPVSFNEGSKEFRPGRLARPGPAHHRPSLRILSRSKQARSKCQSRKVLKSMEPRCRRDLEWMCRCDACPPAHTAVQAPELPIGAWGARLDENAKPAVGGFHFVVPPIHFRFPAQRGRSSP